MELDLNELDRLANAATPGPWILGCLESWDEDGVPIRYVYRTPHETHRTRMRVISGEDDQGRKLDCDSDAAFIAAAHPAVVLELVRRPREAEGHVHALRYIAWESSGYMDAVHAAKRAIGETGALPPPPKIQPARGADGE